MKPARFILNSDYTTVRSTGETKMSITIPNSITVPINTSRYTIGQTTANIGNSADTFMVYYTSDAFPYTTLGWYGATKPDGASTTNPDPNYVSFSVTVSGNIATFEVYCYGDDAAARTWTGYGQTITAHILTFKDPFSE